MSLEAERSDEVRAVAADVDRVVAAGSDFAGSGFVLISDDGGLSWRRARLDEVEPARVTAVIHTPFGWVLGGCLINLDGGDDLAAIWRSAQPDGPYVLAKIDDAESCVSDLVWVGDRLVIVGSHGPSGAVWEATDGVDINPEPAVEGFAGRFEVDLVAAAAGDGAVVAVGSDFGPFLNPTSTIVSWMLTP